jgi:hypothetical protein
MEGKSYFSREKGKWRMIMEEKANVVIKKELQEIMRLVECEEKRLGRKMTISEINDFLIPLIENDSNKFISC